MSMIDRVRGTRRIRIDVGQLADELGKRVTDLEHVDLGSARDAAAEAVHDASDLARSSIDRAAGRARELRDDLADTVDSNAPGQVLDDLGSRLRELASGGGLRGLVARLERELPDTDKDRYDRAYTRGRVQARSMYLAVGLAAGITAGIVGVVLLEPGHGKERREALARRLGELRRRASAQLAETTSKARDQQAARRAPVGVMDPSPTSLPPAGGPILDAGTEPETLAHEALPEPPSASAEPPVVSDPTDPAVHA